MLWKPKNGRKLNSSVLAAEASHALTGILNGLTGFSRVAVAVSGGSDSMALLRLVSEWRTQPNGPAGVFALTVDHGLRAESVEEASRVASWCAALGIEHHVLGWTGQKPNTGIQAKARAARYDLMSAWCHENAVPMLMTAHTADDQAETVLMRQKRTSTDRSLAAIWPENEWKGIKLFRPLLSERRQVLRQYLEAVGQAWLEDPSNDNSHFERVRIRQNMVSADVPALQALAKTAQVRVREADDELRQWLRSSVVIDDYAVCRFPREIFGSIHMPMQVDAMSWALRVVGNGQAPERSIVQSLCHWIAGGRESRRSANGAIVSARRHVIELMREPSRINSRFVPVNEAGQVVFDGRFLVTAPKGSMVGVLGPPLRLKRPKEVPALAFAALPVVKLADGEVICPVKNRHFRVFATLCERFSL